MERFQFASDKIPVYGCVTIHLPPINLESEELEMDDAHCFKMKGYCTSHHFTNAIFREHVDFCTSGKMARLRLDKLKYLASAPMNWSNLRLEGTF